MTEMGISRPQKSSSSKLFDTTFSSDRIKNQINQQSREAVAKKLLPLLIHERNDRNQVSKVSTQTNQVSLYKNSKLSLYFEPDEDDVSCSSDDSDFYGWLSKTFKDKKSKANQMLTAHTFNVTQLLDFFQLLGKFS